MFDTHTHYDHKRFDNGRHELLHKMFQEGLEACVNVAIDFQSNDRMKQELERYQQIYFAVGIHPNTVETDESNDLYYEQELKTLLSHPKVVAVGETGLDYYRLFQGKEMTETEKELLKNRQKVWFRKLIALGLEYNLPLVLHIRDDGSAWNSGAHKEALDIMDEFPRNEKLEVAGVAHCFGGSMELAEEYIKRGYMLGIGGRITYDEEVKLRDCVRQTDIRHLVLETDAPYVNPKEAKGKRNTSENLTYVVAEIARLKEMKEEDVIAVTTENAKRLFGIRGK